MKTLLLLAVPLALVCGAEKKTAAKPAVTQPAAKQAATLLPKEAVLVAPYTYKLHRLRRKRSGCTGRLRSDW